VNTHDLPELNAFLNSVSATWLGLGWGFIRRGKIGAHRFCMVAAVITSSLFLTSYLIYHAQVGATGFQSRGWIRVVYFTILISHTILAAAVVPLVIVTLYRAIRGRFLEHRRLARFTWPTWMYVSITGVVVYVMLYHLDPHLAASTVP
jgi:uncharacterized membrane protein YozB (DUF420 family)